MPKIYYKGQEEDAKFIPGWRILKPDWHGDVVFYIPDTRKDGSGELLIFRESELRGISYYLTHTFGPNYQARIAAGPFNTFKEALATYWMLK